MDYNLLNGGLVLKANNQFFISDIKNLLTNVDYQAMFWFMNYDGDEVYFSDQRRNHSIYKWNIRENKESLVLEKPCYQIVLHGDILYYINENDRNLYCCTKNGKSVSKVVNEEINCFIVEGKSIYYSTASHIKICSLTGTNIKVLCNSLASIIILINETITFADRNNNYTLTMLDINTLKQITMPEISVSFMNTDGQYLYCTNSINDNNIFRVNPQSYKAIRMLNEQASYLHIVDDELYFCINSIWHKMSTSGGKPKKLLT